MTTDPSPPTTLIDKIAANRQPLAYVSLALGVLMAILTITWASRWNDLRSQPPPKPPDTQTQEAPKPDEPSVSSLSDGADYLPAAVWSGLLTALFLGAGIWQISRQAEPGREQNFTRLWIIAVVGVAGLLTALLGLALAWRWQQSILDWINKSEMREARWVIAALAVFLGGLFILFIGVQPARATERDDVMMRRLLYGSNTVISGMLMLLLLIVVNVIVSVKLPEKVVTTATGFKGLSNASLEFLHTLPDEATVYVIMSENYRIPNAEEYGSLFSDCKELLTAVVEASPKIKVKYLSPLTDVEAIREVFDRLKVGNRERVQGLFIGYGPSEELSASVLAQELLTMSQEAGIVFQGENRLMTELSFLSGGAKRPIVYFTQSNAELSIEPNRGKSPQLRLASLLVEALKDRKYEIRPLVFEPGKKPNLPDATMLIIAAPRIPFDRDQVIFLREYLAPGKDAPGGKLVAILPAFMGADGKVSPTGLEPLLEEYAVRADPLRIFTIPQQRQNSEAVYGGLTEECIQENHSFSRILRPEISSPFVNVRPISTVPSKFEDRFSGFNLLATNTFYTIRDNLFEANVPQIDAQIVKEAQNQSDRTQKEKLLTRSPVPFAAFIEDRVREGEQFRARPRLLAIGTDSFVADDALRRSPMGSDYLQAMVRMLEIMRERPRGMDIEPRALGTFTLPEKTSEMGLFWLPVGMIVFGIIALGASVWVVRRS